MIALLKKDFNLTFNIKKYIITILVFLLVFLLFSTMFQGYMTEKRLIDKMHVGIVDNEESLLSGMLIENFKSNKEFTSLFTIVTGSEIELMKKFHDNELSAIVHIPEAFTESLLRFKNTPLEITLNSNYPLQNTVLENIMASYSTYIKAVDIGIYSMYKSLESTGIDQEILTDINEKFSVNMVVTALGRNELFIQEPIETFPSATSGIYFLFGGLILMILFMGSKSTGYLSDELSNGTLTRYMISGKSPSSFILSKIIIHLIHLMILLLPVLLIFSFVLKYNLWTYLKLFLFLTFSGFMINLLFMTLGILFIRFDFNTMFATVITFILGIVGGQFLPIQLMPKFIQDMSSFTPNYWIQRASLLLYYDDSIMTILLTMFIMIPILLLTQSILLKRRLS